MPIGHIICRGAIPVRTGSQISSQANTYSVCIITKFKDKWSLTGTKWCDFMVFCGNDYHIERINFDPASTGWNKNLMYSILHIFYQNWLNAEKSVEYQCSNFNNYWLGILWSAEKPNYLFSLIKMFQSLPKMKTNYYCQSAVDQSIITVNKGTLFNQILNLLSAFNTSLIHKRLIIFSRNL